MNDSKKVIELEIDSTLMANIKQVASKEGFTAEQYVCMILYSFIQENNDLLGQNSAFLE